MTLDPTTESIAHFIGLFELRTEELRLRQDYLEFRLKKTEQEASSLQPVGVHLEAPHELLPYAPALAHTMTTPYFESSLPTLPSIQPLAEVMEVLVPEVEAIFASDLIDAATTRFPSFAASFSLTPPGSLISVTLQKITLIDDDLFLNGLGIDFVDPKLLHASLDAIVTQAEALSGFAMPDMPSDGNWMTFAQDMLAAIDAAEAPEAPAQVSIIRGSDAAGVFVDGVAVAEVPVWTDLLPRYLRPETPIDGEDRQVPGDAEAADGETVQKLTGAHADGRLKALDAHDFGRDFEDHEPNPEAPLTGHQVVAGANQAINEIALYSKWLDASVYVVLGEVARLDAISQVNALVEHDTIDGVSQAQPSLATNIAAINTLSSANTTEEVPAVGSPAASFIARLEADLIQVNWVKQYTFATDFDRAEVIFSGSNTYLGLGENQMVNSAVLNEFGYNFDLIFVSGNMVDATIISQKNVLFDSDSVTTAGPAAAADATAPVSAGDPESQPEVKKAASETGFAAPYAEDTAPDIKHVAAETEDAASVPAETAAAAHFRESTAHTAEASQGAAPSVPTAAHPIAAEPANFEAEPEPTTVPEPEQEAEPSPALSLADNLLLNEVAIARTGVDSFVELKEAFREAAEDMRDGAQTLASEVAEDTIFAGKEALRVLQIDGDLARINLFEQTNIIGDADQIRLEMARLREDLGAQAELIAGSNALINRVSIVEDGINSKIMAAQNVYSDALIYQAGLFEANSVPTGVTMSNLTNDAVAAFVAQDATGAAESTDDIAPTGSYDAGFTADVMQTMLG